MLNITGTLMNRDAQFIMSCNLFLQVVLLLVQKIEIKNGASMQKAEKRL